MKWAYLEKQSTTAKMTDLPPTLGSPSMKSIEMHVEGLQEAGRLQRLYLVTLTHGAGAHLVPDQCSVTRNIKIGVEAVKRLLHSLMAS
jgi:hypothetical protein